LAFLAVAALALTVGMQILGHPLKTTHAPAGIVSLELARTPEVAAKIVAEWEGVRRTRAYLDVGADCLYLAVYPLALSLACGMLADAVRARGRRGGLIGLGMSWAVLSAGVFDFIENVALVQVLEAPWDGGPVAVAYWSAVVKFFLILLALGYLLFGIATVSAGGPRRVHY
jgi:hypothetical protein